MTVAVYILLCLIWGSTWLGIKIGLSDVPPMTAAAIRFVLAALILSGICLLKGYQYPSRPRELIRLAYPGIFMYFGSYALVYVAETHISSSLTAVLFAVFPFFVAIISQLKYGTEKLTPLAWAGLLFGFLGVVVISADSLQTSGNLLVGTLLAVAAPLAAAWGAVIHKHEFSRMNIFVAANVQMILGGLLLVIGAVIFDSWSDFSWSSEAVGSILYLAIFGTVIAFIGYYWLIAKTSVVTVSLITFVTPLVAIMLGLMFDEKFTPLLGVGSAMILSGVLLAVRRRAPATS